MTQKINTGGPAFPLVEPDNHYDTVHFGMTLRDWFAGQFLAGIAANTDWAEIPEQVAAAAYRHADAMMAAREESK